MIENSNWEVLLWEIFRRIFFGKIFLWKKQKNSQKKLFQNLERKEMEISIWKNFFVQGKNDSFRISLLKTFNWAGEVINFIWIFFQREKYFSEKQWSIPQRSIKLTQQRWERNWSSNLLNNKKVAFLSLWSLEFFSKSLNLSWTKNRYALLSFIFKGVCFANISRHWWWESSAVFLQLPLRFGVDLKLSWETVNTK